MIINKQATGEKIKALMKENKISINAMAIYLNVTPTAVYKWRRGESLPSIENLLSIAMLLNVSAEDCIIIRGKNENYEDKID